MQMGSFVNITINGNEYNIGDIALLVIDDEQALVFVYRTGKLIKISKDKLMLTSDYFEHEKIALGMIDRAIGAAKTVEEEGDNTHHGV